MLTSVLLASAAAAWVAFGVSREFYGNSSSYSVTTRDEFRHTAPMYYPRLPNASGTELLPDYGRYGGYPLIHGRNIRGPRMFSAGYRGFSYRGGDF